MVGKTLGHYKILEALGAGGMGEVYRAHDTNLKRDVAIKVLPEDFAGDRKRLARFEREARLLASLNHANIATIHGLEDSAGVRFIAMELVDGITLAERLEQQGRIEPPEALEIARQIAEALEAAHESEVVHRDLKPANIMVTPDGKVKVLDFGIAKTAPDHGLAAETALATDLTAAGTLLGTVAYMSPEQIRGSAVDSRIDIWGFGCLVYEMLAGYKAFERETSADTLAAIIEREPEWEALPTTTPSTAMALLKRCLAKDPARRIPSAGELRNQLRAIQEELAGDPAARANKAATRSGQRWGLIAAGVIATLAISWVLSTPGNAPVDDGADRNIRQLTSFIGWEYAPSWSPDGSMITYTHVVAGDADIATLSTAGGDPHILTASSPADEWKARWSPDGSKIAYVSDRGTGTDIYWIAPSGGAEHKVAETHIPSIERVGAWTLSIGSNPWSPDGRQLLFSKLHPNGDVALWRVEVASGEQVQLTVPPPGAEDLQGAYSFDGEHIVFSRQHEGRRNLWIMPGAGGEATPIIEDEFVRYFAWFPDNTLLLSSTRGGGRDLWQVDLEGSASRRLTVGAGDAQAPAVARDGSIAYTRFAHQIDIYWMSPDADEEEHERLTSYTGQNFGARVAPDGNRVVYYSDRSGNFDLWILDRTSGQHRQLTIHPSADRLSDWSPDGDEIVFMSNRDGAVRLWIAQVDTGVSRLLTDHELPWSFHVAEGQGGPRWAPDGSAIGYLAPVEDGNTIWTVRPDGSERRPSSVRGVLSFGWYVDGERVLYTRRAPRGSGEVELRAANLTTGEDRLLRAGAIAEVAVSPDGNSLTFIEAISHFTMELYLLPLAPPPTPRELPEVGGEPRRITFGGGTWHVHSGGWAPDGSAVVYSRDRDSGDIYVMEPPQDGRQR